MARPTLVATARFVMAIVCGLALSPPMTAQVPRPFDGTSIPVPPLQGTAWETPTKLPEKLVSATRLLFDQGMADPRGCEYREVEVTVGSVWGGESTVLTHGWVLPTGSAPAVRVGASSRPSTQLSGAAGQRYVICWSGLVYPALRVGQPADVDADVAAVIEADRAWRDEWLKKNPGQSSTGRYWGVTFECDAVSFRQMTPLMVCLLLRDGHAASAEAFWGQSNAGGKNSDEDPYLMLASQWVWFAFDRAVCAHIRGDDAASVSTARLLTAAQPRIHAAATARGFKPPGSFDPGGNGLPELLKDEERRVSGDAPLPLAQIAKIADKDTRIKALIRALEDVQVGQDGQPGGVSTDFSPIVQALEQEGESAVEPLLECFANDDRLTRSVSFGRDFQLERNLIPVARAAQAALVGILKTESFGPASDLANRGGAGDRRQIAAEIRAYWAAGKGKSPAERFYATLADGKAHPSQWIEAAESIVEPVDVEHMGRWISETKQKPGEVPAIRGAGLRDKRSPSVSELMALRVPQIAGWVTGNSMEIDNAGDATRIALALNKWDPRAAAPVLSAQIANCKAKAAYWSRYSDTGSLVRNISDMSAALGAFDAASLKDYCAWARDLSPELVGGSMVVDILEAMKPLWQNPDNPDVSATAEYLFNDPAARWRCLPTIRDSFCRNGDLVASPMIAAAGFRKSVIANLSNRARIGTIYLRGDRPNIDFDSGMNSGFGFADPSDPLAPKPNEKRSVRVCDWYAWKLATLDGSPPFEPYWPEEKRDAAFKAMVDFVTDWGSNFRWNEQQQSLFAPPFEPVRMTFARRNRPATRQEVDAHGAIFSLDGSAKTRVVPLASFPAKAKWTTLKRFVVYSETSGPDSQEAKLVSEFDQDGLVWQAEEAFEDGQWKRYYGFVGHHIIAKVPAEEIEFVKGP